MEYRLTDFSQKFFPKLAEGKCLAGFKENLPYVFSQKRGYVYRYIVVYEIMADMPVRMDDGDLHCVRKSYLCGLGYTADGFRMKIQRLPVLDLCDAVYCDIGDKEAGVREFFDKCREKLKEGLELDFSYFSSFPHEKGDLLTILQKHDPRLKPPEAQSFVCGCDLIENQGFVEGFAYDGIIPFLLKDKVIVRDDSGVEHVMNADLFRPE